MSAELAAPDISTLDADDPASCWSDALLAARLFAVDPAGLGGVALHAGAGPVRDLWNDYLHRVLPAGAPVKRMPITIEDDRLLGGVDLAATLRLGKPVVQCGILIEANGGIVTNIDGRTAGGKRGRANRCDLDRREVLIEREGIARCVQTMIGVVAFDESASPEEFLPPALGSALRFISSFPVWASGI